MDSNQENSVNNDSNTKTQKSIVIGDSVEETNFSEILEDESVQDSTVSEDSILKYYTLLDDLNAELNVLFSIFNKSEESDQKELSSVGFQFQFNSTPMQLIFIPDQEYHTIISEYSLLEDLVKTSNHHLFGGEFEPGMTKKEFDSIVDSSLNNLSSDQLAYILASNRNVQISLLEIHLSTVASNNPLPVQVNFRRLGADFIGTSIVHHIYNTDQEVDELYNKITNISALQSAYIGNLGATYLSGGVTVPDDIQSYAGNVNTNNSTRKGIGYQ